MTTNFDLDFTQKLMEMSGTKLSRCFSCMCCSSGCQFQHIMDVKPHQVIRMALMGLKEEVLAAKGPWLCVGCNTCSTNCPNAIDIPAVMDAIRQVTIAENRKIPEPNILNFHEAVVNSVERYGRTHKLEIMMRYKLINRDFFSDVDVGIKMLAKRKLDLRASKIKDLHALKKIFEKAY